MNRCPHCGAAASLSGCDACGYRPGLVDGFVAYAPGVAREDAGYDVAHFAQLAPLETGNFWFRARNRLLLRLLGNHASRDACDYLEVGCGTGHVLEAVASAFPRWRLSASDIHGSGLAFASARVPGARLMQMDARQMPFSGSFDVIGAYDVLEHIEDDVRVLTEMARALRPGGIVVLAVPQHRWLWSAQDRDAQHVRRYARGELESRLARAGFDIRWSGSYLALLLPLMALSRLKPASDRERDPYAEFRLPPWLDRALDAVMRIEARMIAAGVRFPFGGSRIVVARRVTR